MEFFGVETPRFREFRTSWKFFWYQDVVGLFSGFWRYTIMMMRSFPKFANVVKGHNYINT